MIYERQHKYVGPLRHVLCTLLYEMLWRAASKTHVVPVLCITVSVIV